MLAEDIEKNALKLDRDERIHLIESLFDSLDQPDPEIEQAWVAESEKRYKSYRGDRKHRT
jgi:putative addiction module component (TIGR02574 family)